MAYEAFARALEKISDTYAHDKSEERLHARDRSEKKSDTADERAYADKVRADQEAASLRGYKAQVDLSYEDWVKKTDKAKADELRDLGVQVTPGMSPQEIYTRRVAALREKKAGDVKSEALATYEAGQAVEDKTLNDPNFASDEAKRQAQVKVKNQSIIDATQADYKNAVQQLRDIVANDPSVASQIRTPQELADQELAKRLAVIDTMPPAQRDAALREMAMASNISGFVNKNKTNFFSPNEKATTPEDARRLLLNHSYEWAQATGVVTPKTEALLSAQAAKAMTAAGYADRPEVTGLIQRINQHALTLTHLGITPETPAFFRSTNAPASTQPATPAASAPVFRAPGSTGTTTAGQPATYFAPQNSSVPPITPDTDPLIAQASQIRAMQAHKSSVDAYRQSVAELNAVNQQIDAVRSGAASNTLYNAGFPMPGQPRGDAAVLQRADAIQKLLAQQAAAKARVEQQRATLFPSGPVPTITPDDAPSPQNYFSPESPITAAPPRYQVSPAQTYFGAQ